MKKTLALLLALAMVFSLAACAARETPATPAEEEKNVEAPAEENVNTPAEETESTDTGTNTSTISADEEAARLGIPAAVQLRETDVLRGKKIGCSIVYKGDEWCATLAHALEALGEYYGATLAVEDGDLNAETVTKQIENMTAAKCDMIMVDPFPDDNTVALMQAIDAGIPVIVYDGYWNEAQNAVTSVSWDQYDTGVITANYFLNYCKAQGLTDVRVVELTNAVSVHCQDRFRGLHDTIDAQSDIHVEFLNKYDSQGNRETAYNAISAIVEPYDFIISDVDNGAQGAVAALQAVGNTDIKVLSMGAYGAEPFGKLHDNDPNYLACLNVDAWVLAQFVIGGAIDYFEGGEIEPLTNIDLFMVDSSNVEDFWSFD